MTAPTPLPLDRPVVVTGASSGIGAATARLLGASGHPVIIGARRTVECESVAAEIRAVGGIAHAVPLDLADEASIAAFVKQAHDLVGGVDVLVSNAAESQPGSVMAGDRESFERHLQVNLHGMRSLVQAFGAGMIARSRGDLVFVTSEVLRAPRPGLAPYVASKYAVEGLVAVLDMELEGTGVRVSRVRPGPTFTEMGWSWDPTIVGPMLQTWERWGLARHAAMMPPEGVAAAVAAAVGAPPGVVFSVLEVEPVAPVEDPGSRPAGVEALP